MMLKKSSSNYKKNYSCRLCEDNKLTKVIDKVNSSMGRDKLRIAVQGFDRSWRMKQEKLSPCYTTRIEEILTVKI